MSNTSKLFLSPAEITAAGFATSPFEKGSSFSPDSFFEISLAEWSLNRLLFSNKITNLDVPVIAKQQLGISVVEYVNQFFMDTVTDTSYPNELLRRCSDHGIKNHLIMC